MRARKVERNNEIFNLWISGTPQKDIAKKYGLSRGRVCKIIEYYRIRPYEYPTTRGGKRNEIN